jgi:putative transposase
MYEWRKMTQAQQDEILSLRQQSQKPWHSPPHQVGESGVYHITAACYEHKPVIGYTPERMHAFAEQLCESVTDAGAKLHGWSVLPNHYHLLITAPDLKYFLSTLGQLHGRTSYMWNGEEQTRGRKVWFNAMDRSLRSDSHYWATVNYIHHNAVHHGYVDTWHEWPFSSALAYLETVGRDEAARQWREYPVFDYGKGWDDPDL